LAFHNDFLFAFMAFGAISAFANSQARAFIDVVRLEALDEWSKIRIRSWPTTQVVLPLAKNYVALRNWTTVLSLIMFAFFLAS
jgi:hypothetical protein